MTKLFHWAILLQDIPDSAVRRGDRGVIVDELPFSTVHQEVGYILEIYRSGETLDVVSVPASWVQVSPEVWGQSENKVGVQSAM
jgi:hypothetical protein